MGHLLGSALVMGFAALVYCGILVVPLIHITIAILLWINEVDDDWIALSAFCPDLGCGRCRHP